MERIEKKNIDDILALTPMQEGMLFHYLKEPAGNAYFEQLSLSIKGDIHLDSFEQAWNFVIRTNEMLRTVFRWEKLENPVQIILKEYQLQPTYYDLFIKAAGEREKYLEEIKVKDREEKFDLTEVPFRVTLCKVQETTYEMIISNHHILYDGWSNGIILKEFFNAYNDLVNGKALVKPGMAAFKEFVQWTKSQDREKNEKSWKGYLKGLSSGTELSIKKRNRREITGTRRYQLIMERDIREELEDFVKRYRRTLASIFYSAWGLLLQRYNSSEDVIFGTTISGRNANLPGIEDMVGLFINTVPLRIQTSPHETIDDLLYRIGYDLQAREEYESFSLVDIKQLSGLGANEEFFDSVVSLENYPLALILKNRLIQEGEQALSVESYSMVEQTHYDLTVGITIFEDFEISLIYDRGVFERSGIINISRHFINIIRGIIADPFGKISDMDIITAEEKNKILYDFNNTGADFPKTKMLQQIFAEQMERTPDNTALVGYLHLEGTGGLAPLLSAPMSISYLELNRQSERLAHMLREKCVQPDTIVGIMADSSMETIIGILAILKAGGAYLPIDPDYPQDRINYMLKDSGARILLTVQEIAGLYSPPAFKIHPKGTSIHLHLQPAPVTSSAYIIYTSGSTGRPKGVLVQHRSVVNILAALQQYYPLMETDAYMLKTSYLFDVSVTELFGWFWAGGKLVLMGKANRKDPRKILEAIKRHHITHINFVPSMFSAFLEISEQEKDQAINQLGSLKYIFLAGEALLAELVNRFQRLETGILLENLYGPTEGTIYASGYSLSQWINAASVPIGKPLANVRLYIFNQYHRVQPIGVAGELCIAGEGIARGYLNRPELTNKKFLRGESRCFMGAVFSKSATPGRRRQKLYKTGDLARWLADGNIEFLGRRDHQVKIRGFRVELGEIENLLLTHEDIKDAAVNVWREGEDGDIYLCAYIVSEKQMKISRIQEYLLTELPDYMVPTYFIRMDGLPLTSSGKIDRKALPLPRINIGNDYAPPRNEIEIKLVKIWTDVLGSRCSKIGINDNFFDLGGHSLKAARVASRIHKELNIIVSLQEIIKNFTITQLAGSIIINKTKKNQYSSLDLVEKKEYYPLSSAQKRLFILQQMEKDHIGYNMSLALDLRGELSKRCLEGVFHRLILRHESFRTSFRMVQGEPQQVVHHEVDFKIEYYDLQVTSAGDKCSWKEERSPLSEGTRGLAPLAGEPAAAPIRSFIRPFDLSHTPLLRVGLIKLKDNRHILMVDMHHIIADGTSAEILTREFMAIYRNETGDLPGLRVQYKDYAEWQKSERKQAAIKQQEEYWIKEFQGDIPLLNLPIDYARPPDRGFTGRVWHFDIEAEESNALKKLARDSQATLYMVLLSLYTIFLAKISNQEDIIVGSPIAGRSHEELNNMVGMFVNTLAVRNFPTAGKRFHHFLYEVKERVSATFDHQDYPYEELVQRVKVKRDTGRNPLFDVFFALQHVDLPVLEIPGLLVKPYDLDPVIQTSKFDLSLNVMEPGLRFTFEYRTDLFTGETIRRFAGYIKQIITVVTGNSRLKLSQIHMLSQEEKNTLLLEFNRTTAPYPMNTIDGLFAGEVRGYPHHAAAVEVEQRHTLTYRGLDQQANQLAHWLKQKGVTTGSIAGIMMDRGLEMIIGMLGILKAGAAYLPIDLGYPEERVNYILADSSAKILVSKRHLQKETGEIFLKDLSASTAAPAVKPSPQAFASPTKGTAMAYVIYTSGSSGRPKGVMIEHRNVVRLVKNTNYIDSEGSDRLLPTGAFAFDITTFETWWPLLNGLPVYLVTDDVLTNTRKLGKIMTENHITILHLIPQLFNQLAGDDYGIFAGLRILLLGGDTVKPGYVNQVRNKFLHLKILHMYGPTENTTFSTFLPVEKDYQAVIPIGKPINNTLVYILTGYCQLQPPGVAGELCVAGVGVSRGYLNNPELTAEKFNHDLWEYWDYHDKNQKLLLGCTGASRGGFLEKSPPDRRKQKIYRTGDLARWLPEGTLEFLGRADQQIKIRGFRVELGEIEACLSNLPGIKDSVLVVKEGETNDKYLCAYIVPDKEIEYSQLRRHLSVDLPDYMIPSYFTFLDRLPLTPNGKVDRAALPTPEIKKGKDYTGPRDETEEKMVTLWDQVLKIGENKISIDTDFFELGGHSLKAAIVIALIQKLFNVNLALSDFFKYSTVRQLSAYIKESIKERYSAVEAAETKEYYPLSSAQKRLYILQQMNKEDVTYHMHRFMTLEGNLEKERLGQTFQRLVRGHESLRTSFKIVKGEPIQQIHEQVDFKVENDRSLLNCQARGEVSLPVQIEKIIREFVRPFDLSKAPLLRVGLLELPHTPAALRSHPSQEGKNPGYILMIDMHHIISDGTSTGIFIKDFLTLYAGEEKQLPAGYTYKDYSEWQNNKQCQKQIKTREQYWLSEFKQEIPLLELPWDFPRPMTRSTEGKNVELLINRDVTKALKQLAKEEEVTLFMVLIAVYNVLLSKLSWSEDIVVGIPTAGRSRAEFHHVIGMFVNTLALRNYPSGEKSFCMFLKEVKKQALGAFENQDYPFEDLVEKIAAARDPSRHPMFDTLFTLQNLEIPEAEIPGLTLKPYEYNLTVSRIDMTWLGVEKQGALRFTIEYSTKLFNEATIKQFGEYFKMVINAVLEDIETRLKDIELSTGLTEVEETAYKEEAAGDFRF